MVACGVSLLPGFPGFSGLSGPSHRLRAYSSPGGQAAPSISRSALRKLYAMHLKNNSVVFRASPLYRTCLYPYDRFNVPNAFSTAARTRDISAFRRCCQCGSRS